MRDWNQRIQQLQQRQASGQLGPGMQKRLGNLQAMQGAQNAMPRQPQQNYRPNPSMQQMQAAQGFAGGGPKQVPQMQTQQYSPDVINAGFNALQGPQQAAMGGANQAMTPQGMRQPTGNFMRQGGVSQPQMTNWYNQFRGY